MTMSIGIAGFTSLLWIALFLDVLEGFVIGVDRRRHEGHHWHNPNRNCVGGGLSPSIIQQTSTSSSSSNAAGGGVVVNDTSSSTSTQIITSPVGTNIKITIPPYYTTSSADAHDDDDNDIHVYPSALHTMHVRSILTDEQAEMVLQLATEYANQTGRWNFPDADRHSSYPTCDFPVLQHDDCPTIQSYLQKIDFDTTIFEILSDLYNIDVEDMSYLDLFVSHYQAKNCNDEDTASSFSSSTTISTTSATDDNKNNNKIIDRLELHRDGSLLSFSLLLNDPNHFEGGGTYYDALRYVDNDTENGSTNNIINNTVLFPGGAIRPSRAGDAVLHCGKILHGADTVTSGNRTVLVGFVDVHERCIRPGVLGEACKEFGRMDVAKYRGDVQARRLQQHSRVGWVLNSNSKWLPASRSVIKGMYVPALKGVLRRSDPAFHRIQRLKAEDKLLRSILLPRDEREDIVPWYGGDISVVE
jgi:hypothetical protein